MFLIAAAILMADAGKEQQLEPPLERTLAVRTAALEGRVRFTEVWERPTVSLLRECEGFFASGVYRMDVIWDSNLEPMHRRAGLVPPLFSRWIRDGTHVLEGTANLAHMTYQVHDYREFGQRFYNIQFVDVPLLTYPQTDLMPYRNAKLLSRERVGDVETVVVAPARPQTAKSVATFVLAPSKGWSITAYTVEEVQDGITFTLLGESVPELVNGVWFPSYVRHEQRRQGQFHWAREVFVHEADFRRLDPQTFTWHAIDIEPGTAILSRVRGLGHLRWDGDEAVDWYPGALRRP